MGYPMVTQDLLRQLFQRSELGDIDFKSEPHRLDNDHFKSAFIKDIVSMANTTREGSAYIVIGVKLHADGGKEFIGVSNHPDDADLQDQLNLAKVEPKPNFTYQSVSLDGLSYGVIEIPLKKDGPYVAGRDFGLLKAHRVYFRRGTKNDEATALERRQIYEWFLDTQEKRTALSEVQPIPSWDEFALACHHFDVNRLYLLIVGPTARSNNEADHFLGRLPLSLVLDFDPGTEDGGMYSIAGTELRKRRSVHLTTLKDDYALVPEKACCWYAARGIRGRANSLVEGDWREWNRKYGTPLQELLRDLARASGGRPLTVVSLWYGAEYLREVCSLVDRAFGDSVDYVFAISEAEKLREMAQQFNGKTISMPFGDVVHGVAQNIKSSTGETPVYAGIPTNDGSFTVLSTPTFRWLSEDLEVLHSNIELDTSEDNEDGREFLRGATISWTDLSQSYDAERDKTSRIQEQVEHDLKSRTTSRLNLYHWPGAGGTTVARRIAWNLRRRYPSVILRRVSHGHTIGRFRELFGLTGQPILAVVEGADAIPDRLEQLYTELRSEHIPVVFLSVLRRHELQSDAERRVFLGPNLSLPESYRFVEAYKKVAPQVSARLDQIHEKSELKERTPFHFALTAFGRDYLGLNKYVQTRVEQGTSVQREILCYLAFAYYYGHKPVLAQIFAAHLGHPETKQIRLESILEDLHLELLIQEGDSKWRPAHQLIAEEILQVILAAGSPERRNWKAGLFTWATDFIRMCRKGVLVPSTDLIDILRRIFILRDEHELLGTEGSGSSRFALLIEDLPTTEERLSVLKELVESFSDEAHFWGHLGRFYSIEIDDHAEAITALDRAINLSSDNPDPVLHHMKGMSYRRLVYKTIDALRGKEPSTEEVTALRQNVERAKEAFAAARSLDPDSEHAHISPVQLLLRVLDFGFTTSGSNSRADFLVAAPSGWYREQLDEIENLMERVQGLREGDKQSQYVVSCEAQLDQIYDNYARALEGWNNLLGRRDVFAPPVRRQIVRAYLTRQHRNWASIPQDEIERIVDLMEDNMKEEPASDHNIRLWFRALRYSSNQDIDLALARLANWKVLGDSIEAYFYLYALHVLKAIDGSMIEQIKSEDLLQQMRTKSRNLRNRHRSFDWYGKGSGLRRLVHYSELGEWPDGAEFYANTAVLQRLSGRVSKINGPEAGMIELLSCGLPAFFVPARAGVIKGRDENLAVSFYLGFSYDGLRAWSVESAQ